MVLLSVPQFSCVIFNTVFHLSGSCFSSLWKEEADQNCLHILFQVWVKNISCHLLLFSHCHVRVFAYPWNAAHQASLSFTISLSLLNLMSIESMMPSNPLTLCHPLLLPSSVFPSIRAFSSELVLCIWWSNHWSFIIHPSNEYSGLISFRVDWFDPLTV